MMSVPLHDILLSRRLWTAAARRRFVPPPKAQSSLRTPKASLRLLPEKCRGNHFSKLRASVFRAATAALSECGGSTPLSNRKSGLKRPHSKELPAGSSAEAFHPCPMTAMILCKPLEPSRRCSNAFNVQRLQRGPTSACLCRHGGQASATIGTMIETKMGTEI
jgi:hypothetical protein